MRERMNILHVLWRPCIGGAELFALGLARQQSRNHDVQIWCLGASESELPEGQGVIMHAGNMRSGFDIVGLRRFSRFVRGASFDVVHNHQNLPAVVSAMRAAPDALHVRHEHGSNAPGWKTGRERWLSRLINYRVPLYIANSVSTRDKVVVHEHVSPDKVHVVPCGIELERFRKEAMDRTFCASSLGITGDVPVIGFLGRLHPHKGVDNFLAVCRRLHEHLPAVQFVIAGDGPLRAETEATIKESGLEGVVHMVGFQKAVPAVLACYDVLLVPSRQEAQGLVAAEAMASSVAVVAFAVGGVPEVIGEAGVLIDYGDIDAMTMAAIHLIEDVDYRARIIEAGHRQASQFDMDVISSRVISIYRQYIRKQSN